MKLTDLQKKINKTDYFINKTDFITIHKYWKDLTVSEKDKVSILCIKYWHDKNIKIINLNDIEILAYYLKPNCAYETSITVAGKYKFNIIIYDKDNIRQENIFKLNLYNIVEKLKHYFKLVDINIYFEKSTYVDKKLRKAISTYKHDVIINIKPKIIIETDNKTDKNHCDYNKNNNKNNNIDSDDDIENTSEIVFEYFEKIHNRFSDDDKKILTELFSDEYFVFDINRDNIEEFMKDTIYNLIQLICVSMNDKYELCKILYYNKNYKNKNLIRSIEYFNEIINIMKHHKFDFNDFYNKINPCDIDTEKKISKKNFIEFLEDTYGFDLNIDKNNCCSSEIFVKIIMYLEINKISSPRIESYKNIYGNAVNALILASERIIEILSKQRMKRQNIPLLVKNFLKFHKENLKN
jgi:hypothetical protein